MFTSPEGRIFIDLPGGARKLTSLERLKRRRHSQVQAGSSQPDSRQPALRGGAVRCNFAEKAPYSDFSRIDPPSPASGRWQAVARCLFGGFDFGAWLVAVRHPVAIGNIARALHDHHNDTANAKGQDH